MILCQWLPRWNLKEADDSVKTSERLGSVQDTALSARDGCVNTTRRWALVNIQYEPLYLCLEILSRNLKTA